VNDQYEGQGGSYVVDESGSRQLIERTRAPGEAPPEPPAPAAATTEQPAAAGFFTPVAPAEPTTITE
jgi:hypothetical protein